MPGSVSPEGMPHDRTAMIAHPRTSMLPSKTGMLLSLLPGSPVPFLCQGLRAPNTVPCTVPKQGKGCGPQRGTPLPECSCWAPVCLPAMVLPACLGAAPRGEAWMVKIRSCFTPALAAHFSVPNGPQGMCSFRLAHSPPSVAAQILPNPLGGPLIDVDDDDPQ